MQGACNGWSRSVLKGLLGSCSRLLRSSITSRLYSHLIQGSIATLRDKSNNWLTNSSDDCMVGQLSTKYTKGLARLSLGHLEAKSECQQQIKGNTMTMSYQTSCDPSYSRRFSVHCFTESFLSVVRAQPAIRSWWRQQRSLKLVFRLNEPLLASSELSKGFVDSRSVPISILELVIWGRVQASCPSTLTQNLGLNEEVCKRN